MFTNLLGPLLDDRDLLLVDQRGSGKSGALRCELYSADDPAASLRDLFPADRAASCVRSYERAPTSLSTPTCTSRAISNKSGARWVTSR